MAFDIIENEHSEEKNKKKKLSTLGVPKSKFQRALARHGTRVDALRDVVLMAVQRRLGRAKQFLMSPKGAVFSSGGCPDRVLGNDILDDRICLASRRKKGTKENLRRSDS